ncbi:MAG: purine-nucleoside phosphorylase [Verrucomicrobia bacterium]|nr:purine-nucleoside phosphorylase [Verrucomicrobiota bacterium]
MPRRPHSLPHPSSTAALILGRTRQRPRLSIILGSGFGPVARAIDPEREFPYRDLPGFPVGRAPGHEGCLRLGSWHGVPVAVLSGRAHYYEGFEPAEVVFATRVLAAMGVDTLLATNAAGGIHPRHRVGDFMILSDHINFMGMNPLRGPTGPGEARFVDMTRAYDPGLRSDLKKAAGSIGLAVHEGVYLAVPGPSFETPAEIRAFRRWGADAVGMSTVPEVIAARQAGMRVAACSCITNAAAGLGGKAQVVSSDEVLEVARSRERLACDWIGAFVARVGNVATTDTPGSPVARPAKRRPGTR